MSIPTQIAETVQTAHINRNPDPQRDLNPSTAADKREPVVLRPGHSVSDDGDDDIPLSILRPAPQQRTTHLRPIPDFRFEQSYLHSISEAKSWWKVAWITLFHQVVMPFVQGVAYNLLVFGWRHWNKNVQFHGDALGTRVRRWWHRVNNWAIPLLPRKEKMP